MEPIRPEERASDQTKDTKDKQNPDEIKDKKIVDEEKGQ